MTTSDVQAAPADELAAIEAAAQDLEGAEPEAILRWVFDRYGDEVVLANSFGNTSDIVLLDLVHRVRPEAKVFYLDTDFLFEETYATVERSKERFPSLRFEMFKTDLSPDAQAERHGAALWERDPDLCCDIRKVQPLREALGGRRAWITGVRRDQAATRANTPAVQWDAKFGLAKANPLVNWDEKRAWAYIFEHSLPYNPLFDQGYPSLGCTNCTRAVAPGEDPRAGRWSGTGKIECGLHE